MYEDNFGGEGMFMPQTQSQSTGGSAKIRVIGVGGAGNNAVNRMIEAGIMSADYIVVNTDAQTLALSKADNRIQIGVQLTKGLGAGADPEIGRLAAEENEAELAEAIEGTNLLFITTGMGGGTGTGAAPVIAKIARDKKILTAAVVTKPFEFEGKRRMDNALKGLEELRKYVDTLIIIPNEKISEVVPKNASFPDALRVADEVLKQGIRGIADLIVTPALINLDFADVRAVLKDKGLAHMGVGVSKGENRILEAVRLAVNSPLLETTIEGATGVILNVVGGNDLTFDEVKTAAELIHSVVDSSANVIFGACIDENIRDEVEVTVIATGFPDGEAEVDDRSERRVSSSSVPYTQPQRVTPGVSNQPQRPAAPQSTSPSFTQQRPYYGTQPTAQPTTNGAASGQNPAPANQPMGQTPVYPASRFGIPYPSNPASIRNPIRPVTEHANGDDDDSGDDESSGGGFGGDDDNLPPFVRRMLGKKD